MPCKLKIFKIFCQNLKDLAKTWCCRTLLKTQHVFLRGLPKTLTKKLLKNLFKFLLKNWALYLVNHILKAPLHNCPLWVAKTQTHVDF